MTTQPEALRLAELLDTDGWPDAATELRRLHAVNAELLEALKWAIRQMPEPVLEGVYTDGYRKARAAIAKAEGKE